MNEVANAEPVVSPAASAQNLQTDKSDILTAESVNGLFFQAKLTVGAPDDSLEHEADAMAEQVMRMPENSFIQRKCAHCEEEEKVQLKPLAQSITPFIQTKTAASSSQAGESVSQSIQSSRGSGSAMDNRTKSFMSERFGSNFNDVNIHTNANAVQLSRDLNARAFTVGNDIYFNQGQYQPETSDGKFLLAHELTHTIQQSGVDKNIQRTVDSVEINCGDSRIYFEHDGTSTNYHLNDCHVTDGEYTASVTLAPDSVHFELNEAERATTNFQFGYDIGPGQVTPNSFFSGQSSVRFVCTHAPRALSGDNIHFSAKQLTELEFLQMTGNSVDTVPEGIMIPLSNFLQRSLPSAIGPATAGASYFSPTPWSFIPRDVTGVMWTQGHTSIFSNPSGALSPTIRGYRGNLGYYAGESLPWLGRQCTISLHEGVPGSFVNDAWFPLMPGEKTFVFQPRTNEQAIDFAGRLEQQQYGGEYTYSPPRSVADPVLGEVRPTESALNADLIAGGKAPMCTNNCITVPQAEIVEAMGGRPVTPGGVDVMTGTTPNGTVDPHYAGRGRLMTDAMDNGPIPAGATRMNVTVTTGGAAGMFIFRGAGKVMLVYGIYHTADRLVNTPTSDLPVVISEEAGSWGGGILGSALGGAGAGAIFCSPTGPIDAVCVVGGFLGGLLFGIAGSSVGHSIGNFVGENVVSPVVDTVDEHIIEPIEKKAAELESDWTREIYNLYGVPRF